MAPGSTVSLKTLSPVSTAAKDLVVGILNDAYSDTIFTVEQGHQDNPSPLRE